MSRCILSLLFSLLVFLTPAAAFAGSVGVVIIDGETYGGDTAMCHPSATIVRNGVVVCPGGGGCLRGGLQGSSERHLSGPYQGQRASRRFGEGYSSGSQRFPTGPSEDFDGFAMYVREGPNGADLEDPHLIGDDPINYYCDDDGCVILYE